jgi:nitrogen-specific signal transduction histidine kinase
MVDLAPQIMLLVNKKGIIARANLAFLKLLGTSDFKSVIDRKLSDFLNFKVPAFMDDLLAVDNYGLHEMETTISTTGVSGDFSYTVVGVQNQKDLVVLIIENITQHKKKELQAAKEQKTSTVKELAGALMHSINQRLTVINMRSKLLLMAMDAGGTFNSEEHRGSLYNIMDLSMEIAAILDSLEGSQEFDTKEYMKGIEILDLKVPAATSGE